MSARANDLDLANDMADIADTLTMRGYAQNVGWLNKADGTPVSEVDYAVEAALRAKLVMARPEDAILAEETAPLLAHGENFERESRLWILDPLDQTRHFLRHNPDFATLIALVEYGVATVSVVSAPALNRRWSAIRGGGAKRNGDRISVSRTTKLEDAHLAIAGHREWLRNWEWEKIERLLDACAYPSGCAGGYLQQMLVAEGIIDLFAEPWGQSWDHAAPSLVVQEAGGAVSRLDGSRDFGVSLLASNGLLHDRALPFFSAIL